MEHSRLPRREAGRLRVWPSAVWAGGRAVAPSQAEQGSLLCRPRPPRGGGRRTRSRPQAPPSHCPPDVWESCATPGVDCQVLAPSVRLLTKILSLSPVYRLSPKESLALWSNVINCSGAWLSSSRERPPCNTVPLPVLHRVPTQG